MRALSRVSAVVAVVGGLLVATAPLAQASPIDCQYTKTKKLVTLTIDNATSTGWLYIERSLGTSKIGYRAEGDSWKGCEGARTTDTNKIKVIGSTLSEDITINLENGAFAPGASNEANGVSEIEFEMELGTGTDSVTVLGGTGGDRLGFPKAGQATFNGDSDVDVTMTGVNQWTLDGGAGNDVLDARGVPRAELWGREGSDRLIGGPGPDDLFGDYGDSPTGDGNDVLIGGGGDDDMYGYRGSDDLNGGDGDDDLYGYEGNDTLLGGPGDDGLSSMGVKDGADRFAGGAGNDYAAYWDRTSNVKLSLDGKANDGGKNEKDSIAGDIERLYGGDGNDTLVGNGAPNDLNGDDGNDVLKGLGADDDLDDGPGNDKVYGGPGDEYFSSELGNDEVEGGPGNDNLYAGSSNDGSDVLSGGPGQDSVNYQNRSNALTLYLNDTNANDGEAGENDKVKGDFEYIYGGSGADLIRGTAIAEYINAGGGVVVDVVNGNGGADRIYGNDGNDTVIGGEGYDEIDAGNGDDYVQAEDDGEDYIQCGSGLDEVQNWDFPLDTDYNCESWPL